LTKRVRARRLPVEGRATPGVRAALGAGVALTLLAGLMNIADAAPRRQQYFFFSPSSIFVTPVRPMRIGRSLKTTKKPPRGETAKKTIPEKQGFPDIPKGVHQIVVSIGTQRVTLFTNGVRVAQGPVSTGTASNPTPLGVFSVIEKDRYHRSNLYGNAPMFFMQRLTWSGVAMHEGPLPGYPASHGCIRLTRDFASRLWPTTRLGARVIVARSELAPVEFSHPALFVPKPKPPEPKVATKETTGEESLPVRMAEATIPGSETPTMRDVTAGPPAPADDDRKRDDKVAEDDPPPAETVTGTVQAPAAADDPIVPGELRQSVETAPMVEPSPSAAPASDRADGEDPRKPASTFDPPKPIAPPRTADQPQKRKGQVAVFVSRKEKKLFVRQGFIPLFEMPIVIERPDQPLGTHVFTAMEITDNGAGMR
jgi:lipoprotein-anchoring transpeptidase ErfK/SrfK